MLNDILGVAAHGISHFDTETTRDIALATIRIGTGTFFTISGFNKLFNKQRHADLVSTFKRDNVPFIKFNQWWVPGWELVGGLMLALGLFSAFAATVLLIICIVACVVEAPKMVESFKPINAGDRVADYLYLPEVLYIFMLAVNIIAGTGAYSIDALLLL